MYWKQSRLLLILLTPHLVGMSPICGVAGDELTYEQAIRPIFRAHCFDCHGAGSELKGGLDLRLVRSMNRGGDSGPAIVARKPEQSYLVDRIRSGEMPPGGKKLTPQEIETIVAWIAAGTPTARPEPESIGEGLGITPEERSFWSFRPIHRPQVQDISSLPPESRVRTPIDALLFSENRSLSVTDSNTASSHASIPEADRRTLILRASFQLTGLPPSPEEMQTWLSEPGTDWLERLVNKLLESPHYGEQWGRHWLDVAGYADSEGYTLADAERLWAWKYRDWVIRALNADQPFDQFLTQQLAGDELAGPRQGDLTPAQIELLTATGFLRMAADGTGSGADNAEARNQTIADTLKIIGTSLLGLSLQCAQCHDHRYDPIPQTDYFALRAVFEPALDWQSWQTPDARRISLYTAADREKAAAVESQAQQIAAEKNARQAEYMKQALDKELSKYDEPLRARLREAYETPEDRRTDEHKQLLSMHPSLNISPGNLYQYIPDSKPKLAEFDERIAAVRATKPAEEFLRALVEPPNHAPETKLFHRGDHRQPKQVVTPAALTVVAPEGQRIEFPVDDATLPSTGRRLAFAKWLTSRENPLLARVIVNRVWMHHFGKGLVATPADFGRLGARPSHPQLLDWLADEFMTSGWSLKALHRLIMNSTVWRAARTSTHETGVVQLPGSLHRLEAETLRDRMLAASGQLDRGLFGPPLKITEDDTGQIVVDGTQTRRSLYIQARRSRPVGMLQTFDAPVMETNCECRSNSTVATQSLMLLNGQFILDQAAKLAERAEREAVLLAEDRRATLPPFPKPLESAWQYGFGSFDESSQRVQSFTLLPHWTGSQWQGGETLPDPRIGWVLLHAEGGHPDIPERAAIRRWTAPCDGSVTVSGMVSHGSANGDGVQCLIVASRSGKIGEWVVHNGSTETRLPALPVTAGDTLDFLCACRTNVTSDSFRWPVQVMLQGTGTSDRSYASVDQFRGPAVSYDTIPGQIVRAWQLAYCREPTDEELALAVRFVGQQLTSLPAEPNAIPQGTTVVRQAITNLCQVLLSSNEFLYVE